MAVIIKNNTISDIFIDGTGTNVPGSSQITVDPKYYLAFSGSATTGIEAEDPTFIANINSGNLLVNDGSKDLSVSDGLRYLQNLTKLTFKNNNLDLEDAVTTVDIIGITPTNPSAGEVEIDFTPLTKKTFYAQFQRLNDLNFEDYLYSFTDIVDGSQPESGNASNGYQFQSSAPILCPFNGTVVKAVWALKGAAVSGGTVGSTVTLNTDLYSVGFNGEGIKLGDVDVDIDSSQFTIGTFFNSFVDTDFKGSTNLNISVSEGDLLALKFIDTSGPDDVEEMRELTVCLIIEED
jgi:hypothetical protein